MNNISCISVPYKNNECITLKFEDILYIEKLKTDYLIGTLNGKYNYSNSYTDIFELFKKLDDIKFIEVAPELLINFNKITFYDSFYYRVYFSDDLDDFYVSTKSLAIKVLSPLLGKTKDHQFKNNFATYYPLN